MRGESQALLSECARLVAPSQGPSRLLLAPSRIRAWHGLRLLLEKLRELLGQEVEPILACHRAALSLLPGDFGGKNENVPSHGLLAARSSSHLSHNFLLQTPFFSALADLVDELTQRLRQSRGSDFRLILVVPNLALLDRESLGLLRTLFRRHPQVALALIAGFDPNRRTPEPDSRGLIWELSEEVVWQVALGLMAAPGTVTRDVAVDPSDEAARGIADSIEMQDFDPSDTALDSRAFFALQAAPPQNLSHEVIDLAARAMRCSFECFAFGTTLRLGLALLGHAPQLSSPQEAEVHGLLALAAHNRQFRSQGNLRLASFLKEHLSVAFEAEARPDHRSALAYRLAVTYGRRLRDQVTGLSWADRSIHEAQNRQIDSVDAANLESWGRNIKAFLLTCLDRADDASQECETAFHCLDKLLRDHPDALQSDRANLREAAFSRPLLADNLGAIAHMTGDPERLEIWKGTSNRLHREVPGIERYEARFWISQYRLQLRLDAAAQRARSGLDAALESQDALREYRYTVELADLSYRLGDAQASLEAYESAERLRQRLGDPGFLKPTRLSAAAAASRAGEPGQALARIASALDNQAPSQIDARSHLLAFRGLVQARAQLEPEAEASLNEAIELAVESGERDTLLTVAINAGRVAQLLGRGEEAASAYQQALEIAQADAESAEESAQTSAAPALELAASLGAWETGQNIAHAARCLKLLTAALEDPETWWRLPRLEAMITANARLDLALSSDSEHSAAYDKALGILSTAAGQRATQPTDVS